MRWTTTIVPAVALAVVLAGCSGPGCNRLLPVSATDVAPDAPAEDGNGTVPLSVTVRLGAGGPPLPGAAVVAYWAGDGRSALDGQSLDRVGADATVRSPRQDVATPHPSSVLHLRTGPDGVARAWVPEGRIVGLVAGNGPAHTQESMPHVLVPGHRDVELPLYATRVVAWANGTLTPAGASTDPWNPSWAPQQVRFAATEEGDAGYMARLSRLDATLSWRNEPLAHGDLGVGLGDGERLVRHEAGPTDAGLGPMEQSIAVRDPGNPDGPGWAGMDLTAGPTLTNGFVSPFGLAYTLHVEAAVASPGGGCVFIGEPAPGAQGSHRSASTRSPSGHGPAFVPGVGALALGGLLLGLALAARRRRAT